MAKSKSGTLENGKDTASPGKIFVGGLPKDTSLTEFTDHFAKYGEIVDSVIMKDRSTGFPRGFGFITYSDPSVVDKVIQDTHTFSGKTVEIKRTIPKGAVPIHDFKTKKIFVGGIPTTLTEDEFKNFFTKYGKVVDHQIIKDHSSNRSRGFGFIVFDSEQVVDDLLVKGNMIELAGTQVEIKKAEPKKPSNPPSATSYHTDPRDHFADGFGSFHEPYGGYGGSAFGPPHRAPVGGRFGAYGGYGPGPEFGGGYGGYGGSGMGGGFRGEPYFGYSGRMGSYGGGGYGGGYRAGPLGEYGRGESFGGYPTSPVPSYGPGSMYGGRSGYSGSARYHPYAR